MDIEKIKEALRKPEKREADTPVTYVAYGASSSQEEEIGRRVKTEILPALVSLMRCVEGCHNMYSGTFEDEEKLAEVEKLLAPMQKLYERLEECEDNMLDYIKKLSQESKKKNAEK